jgi:endonuclease/exonuclease/phosphatase family metal-dependent hydrolase
VVLVGDFNGWDVLSIRGIARRFPRAAAPRTYPSRFPAIPLDRVFVRPAAALLMAAPLWSAETRLASDYLPLLGLIDGKIAATATSSGPSRRL